MRNAVFALVTCLVLAGCSGPIGPIPGGELEGEEFPWPEDWAFTDPIENVLLQTNPADPYSVTIWCVSNDGHLYFAAADSDSKWVLNINVDPAVVLSVDGKLIHGLSSRVTSSDEIDRVVQAYLKKYEIESEEDFVQEGGVLFRLNRP